MRHTRIATFILGAWFAGTLALMFAAARSFDIVDEVLLAPPPPAGKMIQTLGEANARALLRHLAAEENSFYFESWEVAEMGLGLALTGVLFLAGRSRALTALSGAIVILTLFCHLKITPELAWLGGPLEFAAAAAASSARDQFWRLHAAYSIVETAKLVLGCVIAVFLFRSRRRSRPGPAGLDAANPGRQHLPVSRR